MMRFAFKALLTRKLRTALTAVAIILGVATVSGTFVLTDSIDKAFDAIFSDVYRNTDATITPKSAFDVSGDSGTAEASFDQSLLAKVKALPDVKDAIGGVASQNAQLVKDGKAIAFGGAPNLGFSVDPTKPQFNSLALVEGAWPRANQVVVDKSTADKKDLAVGSRIGVQVEGPVEQLMISGIVKFGAVSSIGGATLAGFDLATAQRLFDKPGKLDQIRAAAKPGVSPATLISQIREILPPNTEVRTGDAQAKEDAKDTDEFISFLRYFLLAFGLIALFVGAFVIVNSLSITVAQRTRELATLRTLGASRRQVRAAVVFEALVMGVIASVVGLFLGLALAKGLFSLFDAVGFTLPNNGLLFETRTIVVSLALGIVVTLIASFFPALRATRVPPIAAVREGAEERDELVGVLRVLFGLGVPGADLCVRRQDLADLGDERRRRDAGLGGGPDLIELPRLVEQPLSRGEIEPGERGPSDRADRAELDDSGDHELLDGPLDLDADTAPHREVLLVGRRLVDDDLVRPRPCSLDQRETVELRLRRIDREAEVGRSAEGDRLAVLHELRVLARDAADRVLDVGQRLHLRQ